MRLGHFRHEAGLRMFAADDQGWIDVAEHFAEAPHTVDELIREPRDWLSQLAAVLHSARVPGEPTTLSSPLESPPAVLAIGLNYADHCREFGVSPPSDLVLFVKHPSSVVGPGDDVVWSTAVTDSVDWEAELGVIIGAAARNVSEEEALGHVFGYTAINDVTARDIQQTEQQWVRAKSLETFCPMGPVIVTADDVPDPQCLSIRSRISGETMQDSNTKEMIFTVAQIISRLSQSFTLLPGDIIATGTPLGVGSFRTPKRELKDGDVMEVEIEGIGTLVNTCRTRDEGELS
jgi:2-keto-4-pentenoate hydratase/2-oxohepta-3-ene-1,7-dioic acid hydratase in catechol pathway